jgi:hypothetical protein
MNEQNDDSEISLLDIFVALIRYRKLIIGITLCSLALAVAGYFVIPARQYGNAVKKGQTEGRIIISIKEIARPYLAQRLEVFFNRPDAVLDSLRDAGMENYEYMKDKFISLSDETLRARSLSLINERYIQNKNLQGNAKETQKLFEILNPNGDVKKPDDTVPVSVEVIFKDKDPEIVALFLRALFNKGNAAAGEYIRPYAMTQVESYELIMNSPAISETMKQLLEKDFANYAFLKSFLAGGESVLAQIGEPVINTPEIFLTSFQANYFKIGIIIVFAGAFFAVFLALCFNACYNIKNDERAMKKIRDALKK